MNTFEDQEAVQPRITGKGLLALAIVFVVAALVLRGIFNAAEIYGDQVGIARYCDDPAAAATRVGEILTNEDPAGGEERRPYIVAAKLIYLVPQRHDESVEAYVERLADHISAKC